MGTKERIRIRSLRSIYLVYILFFLTDNVCMYICTHTYVFVWHSNNITFREVN